MRQSTRRCFSQKEDRVYEYVIDHQGHFFLRSDQHRTIATAYRDKKFLDQLYRGLRRRKNGLWTMSCAGEVNILSIDLELNRDDVIVVFNELSGDPNQNEDMAFLTFAGTMKQRFLPNHLRFCPYSLMFFHRLTERNEQRYGAYGLLSSSIAHTLSPFLTSADQNEASSHETESAIFFNWHGHSHKLKPLVSS